MVHQFHLYICIYLYNLYNRSSVKKNNVQPLSPDRRSPGNVATSQHFAGRCYQGAGVALTKVEPETLSHSSFLFFVFFKENTFITMLIIQMLLIIMVNGYNDGEWLVNGYRNND